MFCSNCGSQIKEGYAFCPSCGNQVKDTTLQSGQPTHLHIEHKNLIIEKALQSTNQVAKNSFSAISNATRFFIRSLPRIIAISIVAFIITFVTLAVYSKTEIAQFEADELASKIIDYDDLLSSHQVFDVFIDDIIDKEFWLKGYDTLKDDAVISINEDRISYRVFVGERYAGIKQVYPYFNRYFGNTGVIKVTNIEKGDQLAKITLENNLVLDIWRIHDGDQYALAFMHDDKEVYIRLDDRRHWSYKNTRTTFNEVFGFDVFENKYD